MEWVLLNASAEITEVVFVVVCEAVGSGGCRRRLSVCWRDMS